MASDRTKDEQELWEEMTIFEQPYWAEGLSVAGVDEVGRGPLAGPVVAAVVLLDPGRPIYGVRDSKQLSEKKRRMLYPLIVERAKAVAVGMVGPRTIEVINILEASRWAMKRALARLNTVPEVLLTDAIRIDGPWQEKAIVHGDRLSASVAAASIVAKVVRDRYMGELAGQYPEYGFDQHKGYPTRLHRAALDRHGPCPAHRTTFLH